MDRSFLSVTLWAQIRSVRPPVVGPRHPAHRHEFQGWSTSSAGFATGSLCSSSVGIWCKCKDVLAQRDS
eukprot:g13533.t1